MDRSDVAYILPEDYPTWPSDHGPWTIATGCHVAQPDHKFCVRKRNKVWYKQETSLAIMSEFLDPADKVVVKGSGIFGKDVAVWACNLLHVV